jgi:hypothetical protein
MNLLLEKYLEKRLSQPTVILCFRILLDNTVLNGLGSKMTKSEIEAIFNAEHKRFGVQTFRRDYVMRQSSNKNNAIDQIDELFFIREEYLQDITQEEMKQLSSKIDSEYSEIIKGRNKFIGRLKSHLTAKNDVKYEIIKKLLLEEETDRKGQNFEVTSYAILKTFYETRGFMLNRFSTIYANDGGVDFAAQNAIYQVTTQLNDKKLLEDLDKAPLKKRIFVYREASSSFDVSLLDNELIVDHIDKNDLLNHLTYLKDKNPKRHLTHIIETIIEEFNREYYV